MLVSQTDWPCPKHSASTLLMFKTKVINSLTLKDPPYCQSLLLAGYKMRHFWKDNVLAPGKRYFKTKHLIVTFKEKPPAYSPSQYGGDHISRHLASPHQKGLAPHTQTFPSSTTPSICLEPRGHSSSFVKVSSSTSVSKVSALPKHFVLKFKRTKACCGKCVPFLHGNSL